MTFTFGNWRSFCKLLADSGIRSVTASTVMTMAQDQPFVVLKHDVETAVQKAFRMAEIEHNLGHCGTYYVQAYLLNDEKNVTLLRQMKQMGHEISYHFDVLDSNHGDMDAAIAEFDCSLRKFSDSGFDIVTLCQHGNPVIERVGYTSNRDFFRSERVQKLYPGFCDIMVDFPAKSGRSFLYFSDAGRMFHQIFDPINNDRVKSDDKDIAYDDLKGVFDAFYKTGKSAFVSVHPHRYTASAIVYSLKSFAFRVIRGTAKLMMKIPLFKRVMAKYYYLAKKI